MLQRENMQVYVTVRVVNCDELSGKNFKHKLQNNYDKEIKMSLRCTTDNVNTVKPA